METANQLQHAIHKTFPKTLCYLENMSLTPLGMTLFLAQIYPCALKKVFEDGHSIFLAQIIEPHF